MSANVLKYAYGEGVLLKVCSIDVVFKPIAIYMHIGHSLTLPIVFNSQITKPL